VFCFVEDVGAAEAVAQSVASMVAVVQGYVPGYRLKQAVQFDEVAPNHPVRIPGVGTFTRGLRVGVFLEVEGAGHYLPSYAGNLDIMTSAALRTGEQLAAASAAPALTSGRTQ
jgi:acetaldehyde dehydrogenase